MKSNLREEIEKIYPIGFKLTGTVEHHAPFGIFVDIGHHGVKGLVQITDYLDGGVMSVDKYPVLGSIIDAVVLGYTEDDRDQIWLSVKPSILAQSTASAPIARV